MITVTVTGDTADEVLTQLRGLAGTALINVHTLSSQEERAIENDRVNRADDAAREAMQAERDAKPKATRKPKAAPVEETPPAAEEPVAEEPKALVFETDVAPIVLGAVQKHGKPAVEAVLDEFGVERASQMEAARWPELIQKLQGL